MKPILCNCDVTEVFVIFLLKISLSAKRLKDNNIFNGNDIMGLVSWNKEY